jgi:hypothetical protein
MSDELRLEIGNKILDLINPYLEEEHVGDVFYTLMAIATRLNMVSAEQYEYSIHKCVKKSRRPIRDSELEPIPDEGN